MKPKVFLKSKPFFHTACPEAKRRLKKWGLASFARQIPIFSALLSARALVKKKGLSDNQDLKNSPPYNHPDFRLASNQSIMSPAASLRLAFL